MASSKRPSFKKKLLCTLRPLAALDDPADHRAQTSNSDLFRFHAQASVRDVSTDALFGDEVKSFPSADGAAHSRAPVASLKLSCSPLLTPIRRPKCLLVGTLTS